MVIVEYNGIRLKASTMVEDFRVGYYNKTLFGDGYIAFMYMKYLFPEEYDNVYKKTTGGGGFSKEEHASYNIFAKYMEEANKGLVHEKMNHTSNKEMDEIHYKTLNYIFKDVLKITDFKIYKLSSPEATEQELHLMKNMIY